MKIIDKSKINQLCEALSREARLLVPGELEGVSRFIPWSAGMEPLFQANVTIPPKELLFPQTETMYYYHGNSFNLEVEEVVLEEPTIAFGVRSCDVQSFDLMDRVFLTKGFVDQFYRRRRENLTIIALGCLHKGPACFCDSLGIDPGKAKGADVQAYDLGQGFGFEARTEKGEQLLDRIGSLLTEAQAAQPEVAAAGGLAADLDGIVEKLQKMFYHPYWDKVNLKCLGCGTCTFLCPTCHCFDIQSQNRGQKGSKFRSWDSCMFSEYTLMAGGHNPRPSRKERVRQRFLHKLQYFPERYGEFGCVGCGRCVLKCPVNVDITKVISQVREVAADA